MRNFPDHLLGYSNRGITCVDEQCPCADNVILQDHVYTFPELHHAIEQHRRLNDPTMTSTAKMCICVSDRDVFTCPIHGAKLKECICLPAPSEKHDVRDEDCPIHGIAHNDHSEVY